MPTLVQEQIASRITAQDPTLWGPDAQPEAKRSVFGRTDLCAADCEILTELGLPRPAVETPRPRHTVSASFDYRSDSVPASAPDGSPLRPPRLA